MIRICIIGTPRLWISSERFLYFDYFSLSVELILLRSSCSWEGNLSGGHEVLEDRVDHQPDGFSRPVNAVVSPLMKLTLGDKMQIHHIKTEGSRVVSHHVVGLHDVEPSAPRQELHPLETKNPLIHIHCYLQEKKC